MCQKRKKHHSATQRDQTGFLGRVCVARALFHWNYAQNIADSWTQLDTAKPHPASNLRKANVCQLNAPCSSTEFWLQGSVNQWVIRDVFCPPAAPEGCGEQSCVSGDLLRQPPARAREPLCAAGDDHEPTGQDKVSANCSKHSLLPTWPTTCLISQTERREKNHTLDLSFFIFSISENKNDIWFLNHVVFFPHRTSLTTQTC